MRSWQVSEQNLLWLDDETSCKSYFLCFFVLSYNKVRISNDCSAIGNAVQSVSWSLRIWLIMINCILNDCECHEETKKNEQERKRKSEKYRATNEATICEISNLYIIYYIYILYTYIFWKIICYNHYCLTFERFKYNLDGKRAIKQSNRKIGPQIVFKSLKSQTVMIIANYFFILIAFWI